jgi:hypothetical protein
MGREQEDDPYHIDVIKSQLTRNIGNFFADLHEEIEMQFALEIPATKGALLSCLPYLT